MKLRFTSAMFGTALVLAACSGENRTAEQSQAVAADAAADAPALAPGEAAATTNGALDTTSSAGGGALTGALDGGAGVTASDDPQAGADAAPSKTNEQSSAQ